MKQLKFRVWHHTFKRFLTEEEWFIDFQGNLRYYDINLGEMLTISQEAYTIQQWTGLVDRNGGDIYDGDMVKLFERMFIQDECSEYPHQCLVDILHGISNGFHFRRLPLDENAGRCINSLYAEFQIIGNIFTTPDLIKN